MTAEIAILNKHGVALAADSKVSITSSAGGKAYDSVNKVFTLSKYEPVGVMVFGSAEFMRTPWELIIKSYRSQLGRDRFDTVDEYSRNFLEYTTNFVGITVDDIRVNVLQILSTSFQEDIEIARTLASERDFKIGSPAYVNLLREFFEMRAVDLCEELYFEELPERINIARFHLSEINGIVARVQRYKSKPLQIAVRKYCFAVLFSQELTSQASGIVFAGYGTTEPFPVLVEFGTDGIVRDTIKLVQKTTSEITKDNSSILRSFAQHDMVQSFMSGINGELWSVIGETFSDAMQDLATALVDKHGTRSAKTGVSREKVSEAVKKQVAALSKEIVSYSTMQFVKPVMDMAALLPKDEMANLAESLVALTSLKRRVSRELETVGGPIDVAVISKGDGFIWIKRKHYFDPKLNHHFMSQYFAENVP
jgi:hypothetical protein